ncbi:MAG: GNAT family N-acetyltransferase, partial [Gemmataceae bacterium]|nr:GNAT family N-acetyltransferase [Gemmataceae bacterium]
MRVASVDPGGAAAAAARVQADAWRPPCLAYPAAYLRWELAAPGPRAFAVLASDGDEPAGFAAALPRRVRFRGADRDLYLVTFMAVRPGWQGRGLAGRLYDALLTALRPIGLPVVTFAPAGSGGQAALERAYPRAGWSLRPLGEFRVHAAVVPPSETPDGPPADDTFRTLPSRLDDPDALLAAPSPAQWDHLRADPRPRATVVGRNAAGGVVAAATVVRTPTLTPEGPAEVTVIDGLRFAPGGAAALREVVAAAGSRWPDPAG